MRDFAKKEVAFERVVFFSDAIVAIAITLLALDLRLEVPAGHHIVFADLLAPWKNYVAFILSFINIAGFWRTHHNIYLYVRSIDEKILFLNICWLFLIVTLPFATTLLSAHFGDTPAVFLYSLNIFFLSVFQNFIWDYADSKKDFVDLEKLGVTGQRRFRLMFNLDMLNGLIAVVVSFFAPILAFVLLFFKLPVLLMGSFFIARERRKGGTI